MSGHAHDHRTHDRLGRQSNRRRMAATLVLVIAYMFAEAIGGLLTNSLALLADAGHMFSDAAALALSLFALWIAQRPSTSRRSYGYYRAEILAALANGAALGALAMVLCIQASQRLAHPAPVEGGAMLGIALGGLLVNLASMFLLRGASQENLNVRGATLHVISDTLGSIGAILAGFMIWAFGWTWADPVASMLIAVLVLFSSWNLLKETVAVLMESVPSGIDLDHVRRAMLDMPGVNRVHDLHVWTITSGMVAMSGHVAIHDGEPRGPFLHKAHAMLHERFGIVHATLQLEPVDFEDCSAGSPCDPAEEAAHRG